MIESENLGLVKYQNALDMMNKRHAEIVSNPATSEVILVCQHPPVVTMGMRPQEQEMLISPANLQQMKIDYAKIDRGGSVTVHELGQCVIYPLLHLKRRELSVRKFVWLLEEAMIKTCNHFHVDASRDPKYPGVWVKGQKIGAVGVRIKDHVSKHGIAFNVNNSLNTFQHIVPCGIQNRSVTRLSDHSFSTISYPDVENVLLTYCLQLFSSVESKD